MKYYDKIVIKKYLSQLIKSLYKIICCVLSIGQILTLKAMQEGYFCLSNGFFLFYVSTKSCESRSLHTAARLQIMILLYLCSRHFYHMCVSRISLMMWLARVNA